MMDDRQRLFSDTQNAKAQAEQLLADLIACRDSGRSDCADLYKKVTGHSSLEKAIDDTRRLVGSHERLLAQIEKDESIAFSGPAVIRSMPVAAGA